MKALEAFGTLPRSVLVATDVAARGLDIPMVQVSRIREERLLEGGCRSS